MSDATDDAEKVVGNDHYEQMIAMTTGNRKKNLQEAFDNLEILSMPLTETQKVVLMIAMEVRPWSL